MREFTVYAPAKLNLYLDVIGKRPDGYHNIETLFEKIDLKDEIVIKEKNRGIDVKVEPSDLCPSGKDNIVYEAVQALLKESGADLGLEIVIRKKIPVSAGLGGGSSNAASVMLAINKAFELGITQKRLFSMAGQIGKDVPFFMTDHSLALGTGTGDDLEKIDADIDLAHILIKPKESFSTARMYKNIDNNRQKTKGPGIERLISALKDQDIDMVRKNCYNIFEKVLGKDSTSIIDRARKSLKDAGAGHGFLSGSGPTLFCILNNKREAMEIAKHISRLKGMQVFVATKHKGGIYGDN